MTLKVTFLALVLTIASVTLANDKCSWVGTDDGCRDKMTGSICAKDGVAGVCATSYWDHCECAVAAPEPQWKQNKAMRKLKKMQRRMQMPPLGGPGETNQTSCSWVGSDDSCRDKPVGTYCSRKGKAGICAVTHWSQCECASLAD